LYKQSTKDLSIDGHQYTITPDRDQDGTQTSYLTKVIIDNTVIFDLLAEI
jgi:hypothetical protein